MQEDPSQKYAIDEFIGRLQDFQVEVESAIEVYGSREELSRGLTGIKDSILVVQSGLENYNHQGASEFDDYLEKIKNNSTPG